MDSLHDLHEHRSWKRKNKNLVSKDKAHRTICYEYKQKRIDHTEFVRKIVKCNRESEMPRGKKAIMQFIDIDSES